MSRPPRPSESVAAILRQRLRGYRVLPLTVGFFAASIVLSAAILIGNLHYPHATGLALGMVLIEKRGEMRLTDQNGPSEYAEADRLLLITVNEHFERSGLRVIERASVTHVEEFKPQVRVLDNREYESLLVSHDWNGKVGTELIADAIDLLKRGKRERTAYGDLFRELRGVLAALLWLFTGLLAIQLCVEHPAEVRRLRRDRGQCHSCRYDRKGLDPGAMCPECGAAPQRTYPSPSQKHRPSP